MKTNKFQNLIFLAFLLLISLDSATGQTRRAATAKPAATRAIVVSTEPKAVVWLDDVRRGATDENGQLKIDKIAGGNRVLRVRATGFAEKTAALAPTQRGTIKIALTPTDDEAELAFQQAEDLRETGADRAKSEELYRRAFELRPKFPQAHVGLARLLEKANGDEALVQIEEARKDRPVYAEASTVEGRIFREASDFESAIKSFKRAVRESKNFNPEAHTGLALAYKDNGDAESAVAEFKLALAQLSDSEPIVYQLLGETYEAMQRKKEAIAAYEKFLQLAPNDRLAPAIKSIVERLKSRNDSDTIELMPQ